MTAGLSSAEAKQRLAQSGPNELRREAATPAWKLFLMARVAAQSVSCTTSSASSVVWQTFSP
jgi:magnesium-transporting ATPase (P-type)